MAGEGIFELSKLISNQGYDWIVETIFSKLDPESLAKCRLVSKACKERIDNRRSLLVLQLQAMKQRGLNNPSGQEWYQLIGADLVKGKCPWIDLFPEFEQVFLDLERQATLHELQVVVATMRNYLKDGRIRMEKSEINPSFLRAPSSPFHQAIVNGDQEFLHILLRRTTLDAECIKKNFWFSDMMTPLHLAARHGHYEVVKLLLEFSSDLEIDVNALDFDGMTPFIRACAHGHLQVVKLMVNQSRMYHIDLNVPLKYFPRIFIMFPFLQVTMSFVVFMLGYKLRGFMYNFN